MIHRVTLLADHARQLRELVLPRSGHEGAAYALFRTATCIDPWTDVSTTRYLLREIIPIAAEDVVSASSQHIHTKTRSLARVLKKAAETDCVPAFVHGHPGRVDHFSGQDDADEPALIEMAQNRNGAGAFLLSLVFVDNGRIIGRVWRGRDHQDPLDSIVVVGSTFEVHGSGESDVSDEVFHRQALAFGPGLDGALSRLRIGIVGCGATGSAVATLLARLGTRHLVFIDNDTVELTNLNRLHGASVSDVGRLKTEVLRDHIESMGLRATPTTFNGWVGDLAARDLVTACDVIFGCTDDHDGRLFLNRLANFYLTPLFDVGIGIDTDGADAPGVSHAESRVTVVVPGTRCLICRGVADPARARDEDLQRRNAAEYARRRTEGEAYVRGGGLVNPAVVTFTTGVACLAVDELIHRLTGYRRVGAIDHRVVKHHLGDEKRPGARSGPCPICLDEQYWGLGDVEPFLDRAG